MSLPRYWRYVDIGLPLSFMLIIFSLALFGYYLLHTHFSREVEIAFASLIVGIISVFVTIVLSMPALKSIKAELIEESHQKST